MVVLGWVRVVGGGETTQPSAYLIGNETRRPEGNQQTHFAEDVDKQTAWNRREDGDKAEKLETAGRAITIEKYQMHPLFVVK